MTFTSADTVFYTLWFIIPGFLIHSIIAMFVPIKIEDWRLLLLRFLAYSVLNFIFWLLLVNLLFSEEFFKDERVWSAIFVVFVGPIVFGSLFGFLKKKLILKRLLSKIKLNLFHPFPTAWDFKFAETQKSRWLIVTLKDGSTIAGYYGSQSFASFKVDGKDLYLQTCYKICGDNQWQPVKRSNGVYISGDEIKMIEFFNT